MRIKKWLLNGEFRGDAKTTVDATEEAGRILDMSEAGEMFGTNLFKADDGKLYRFVVEGRMIPVEDDEAEEMLANDE